MTKRLLIDATHAEETRVVVLDGSRLEDFDVETSAKKQLKGNIYLAKIVRVEPSLQAAFVEYGGGRHGFLAFGEIHPDYYQIPVADRQRLLAMQAEEARAEAEAEDKEVFEAEPPTAFHLSGTDPTGEPAVPDEPTSEPPDEPYSLPDETDPDETDPDGADPDGTGSDHADLDRSGAEPVETLGVAGGVEADQAAPQVDGPDPIEAETDDDAAARRDRPAQPSAMARDERFGPADAEVSETPLESLDIEPSETTLEEPPEGSPDNSPDSNPGSKPEEPAPEKPEADETADPRHDPVATAADGDERGFADLETPADAAPPPETIGGDPEATGADDARRRRESRFLRSYRIQEVIRRRQIMLIQVVKEERGSKGAALTTYISLAGRFSVLMPNSPRGGGISRKITSAADRRRLKEVTAELDLPQGMGLIVRTAGANRPKPEIKRDCEYLMRLWDDIRELTLRSVAPALIYEEASLIKRAIRDVYSRDIDEIVVDGEPGWRAAHEFMRMLMPSHAKKVQLWRGEGGQPLFAKHQVEAQLDAMLSPTVQLKSGGYLVINQTEALVAVDVNSGRSTRERNIEETAFRTNLEAADEAARQLRLRDLAGLIVIDFIDMESRKNNAAVERRLKEALRVDRARIQVGSISHFGLLEMSRQRLRPSVTETSFVACPHCGGTGHVRSTESAAIHILREIEDEGARGRAAVVMVHAAASVVMFLLNHKRDRLTEIEARCAMRVQFAMDETLVPPACRIEKVRARTADDRSPALLPVAPAAPPETIGEPGGELADEAVEAPDVEEDEAVADAAETAAPPAGETAEEGERRRRRRRRRRGGRRDAPEGQNAESQVANGLVADGLDGIGPGGNGLDGNDLNGGGPDGSGPDGSGLNGDASHYAATGIDAAAQPGDDEASRFPNSPPLAVAEPAPNGPAQDDDQIAAAAPAVAVASEDIPAAEAGSDGPAEGDPAAGRRRGRRGGRRRRRDEGDAITAESLAVGEPVQAQMVGYTGPTPADPFGGTGFDIYDLLDTAPAEPSSAPPAPREPRSAVPPEAIVDREPRHRRPGGHAAVETAPPAAAVEEPAQEPPDPVAALPAQAELMPDPGATPAAETEATLEPTRESPAAEAALPEQPVDEQQPDLLAATLPGQAEPVPEHETGPEPAALEVAGGERKRGWWKR